MRPPGGEHLYRRCSEGHHHHLVCRVCGRTVEVAGPAVESWADRVAAQHGYADVSHTLEIFGTCPTCAALTSLRARVDRDSGLSAHALHRAWRTWHAVRREDLCRPFPDRRSVSCSPTCSSSPGSTSGSAARCGCTTWSQKLAVPGQKLEGAGSGLADNLGRRRRQGRPGAAGRRRADRAVRAGRRRRPLARRRRPRPAGSWSTSSPWRSPSRCWSFPLGLVLFGWLPLRVRWMRRAGSAAKLAAGPAGRDLLALRALATQPLGRLTRIDPDVAEAWRRGDDADRRRPGRAGAAPASACAAGAAKVVGVFYFLVVIAGLLARLRRGPGLLRTTWAGRSHLRRTWRWPGSTA